MKKICTHFNIIIIIYHIIIEILQNFYIIQERIKYSTVLPRIIYTGLPVRVKISIFMKRALWSIPACRFKVGYYKLEIIFAFIKNYIQFY